MNMFLMLGALAIFLGACLLVLTIIDKREWYLRPVWFVMGLIFVGGGIWLIYFGWMQLQALRSL